MEEIPRDSHVDLREALGDVPYFIEQFQRRYRNSEFERGPHPPCIALGLLCPCIRMQLNRAWMKTGVGV